MNEIAKKYKQMCIYMTLTKFITIKRKKRFCLLNKTQTHSHIFADK